MRKRLISIAVVLSIVASMLTFNMYSSAATADTNVNKILLDNLLSDRSWVIDTLINDDYSKNPHAIVGAVSSHDSMMARALSQYGNSDDPNYSPAYKIMVDALTLWYNKGDYAADVVDGVTEWSADALETFGTAEGAQDALRNCADNAKNMQYDNILQEVIKADYTATNGKTLSGSNSQLIMLRKINDGATALKNLASAAKDVSGLDYETALSTTDYINTVLNPASESYEKAISSLGEALGAESGERETALLEFSTFLGRVLVYDSIVISPSESGKVATFAPTYLLDETTKEIIDVNSNIADFASSTIDGYMYIKSIQTQKESVSGVMTRAASNTSNAGTKTVLNRYADLIEDAADGKTANYKYVISTLRQSGVLNKYVEKKASEAAKDVVKRLIPCYENSIAPDVFASVTGVVGTATYLADAVTGLKDTCTKTVELKNLNEIINLFVKTYKQDLANYKSNPTDENAAKVIDDLEFIQRLRLRGETIAYGMTRAQFTSLLGRLLSGGNYSAVSSLDYDYQAHIDALIGASVTPFTTDSFTVNSGEDITIATHPNGFLMAMLKKEGSSTVNFAEPEYRFMNGINVQGGKLTIAIENIATPYIVNNGGSVVLGCKNLREYTQNSGTTTLANGINNLDTIYLNGGTLKTVNIDKLNLNALCNEGGTANTEVDINCKELSVKGIINGNNVYLTGNSKGGGGTVENLHLCGSTVQTLDGDIGAKNITYNNSKGITQNGRVNISGVLKNINTKLKNAKNTVIVDGGKIEGGYYKQDITISGKMSDEFVEFDSIVYVSGAASIGSAKINNMLYQTSGSLNINGDLEIMDTAKLQGSVSQTAGDFILRGNVSFLNFANLNNLVVCGSKAQSISGTITVNDYTNKNTAGLTIGGKINVKGKAKSIKAPTSGASNVTLIDNSSFAESKYYGDITIGNRSGSIPDLAKVYGSIYINGNITQTEADTIIYAIDMNGGNLVVKDCALNLKNRFTLNSGTIALQSANLICNAVFNPSSTVTIDENSKLEIYSDLVNKGTMSGDGTVKVSGNITNSGTMNVGKLILTAESDRNVSGNAITVKEFQATGSKAVNLSNIINVSEGFDLGNVQIDASKIKYTTSMSVTSDSTFKDDLFLKSGLDITSADVKLKGNLSVENNSVTLSGADLKADKNITITSGNLVVGENSKVTCSGKICITNGNITVSDNSTLMVRKNADLSNVNITLGNSSKIVFYSKFSVSGSSSNSITIDSTSSLNSKNLMNVNTLGSITVNGELILGGDAILKSTSLSGSGTATLYGDLYTTSTTNLLVDTFEISGKFAQRINGSGLAFNNLTINNNSSAGVTFDTATYQGELTTGSSIVNGTLTAVE